MEGKEEAGVLTERQTTKLVREGPYLAEVDVTLIETDHDWSPTLSVADARKLDDVRLALRQGDLKTAARLARVFELKPVTVESRDI